MSIKLDHKTRVSQIKLAEDSKDLTVFSAPMIISMGGNAFCNFAKEEIEYLGMMLNNKKLKLFDHFALIDKT